MYKTECNREFFEIKEQKFKTGDNLLVHTKEDEVVAVKYFYVNGISYFLNLDFEGSIDRNEIKGWNYINAL